MKQILWQNINFKVSLDIYTFLSRASYFSSKPRMKNGERERKQTARDYSSRFIRVFTGVYHGFQPALDPGNSPAINDLEEERRLQKLG